VARRARTRPARRPLALGLVALAVAAAVHVARPLPAAAAVTHLHGFRATVDGFTSWYGSYGMGELGPAWCIDHGSRAPDAAYRYLPADLSGVPDDTRAALGWAVAEHGGGTDPVTHAGLMLALHDLMGARYPSGPIDVDHLAVTRLSGFDGQAAQVLAAARAIKADGLAHRRLRGPLALTVGAGSPDAAGEVAVTIALRDATGQGVGGVAVQVEGAEADATVTGTDGTIAARARASALPTTVAASATVPRLPVDAWGSSTTPAQRVARPVRDRITASVTVAAASGQLVIVKHGDPIAWLSVQGAQFHVEPPGGGAPLHTVTVGDDGTTPPVSLPIGTYLVVEDTAPPGYDLAGPWTVAVEAGRTTTLEVTDRATRGGLRISKVDAGNGAPLAGAALEVRYAAEPDDSIQQPVVRLVTTASPTLLDDLLPGPYAITEVTAPPGYERLDEPVLVDVLAGATAEVVLADLPIAPPTTTPTTAAPPTTAPPVTVLASPAAPTSRPALPRTGADTAALVLVGIGLTLVGWSFVDTARLRTRRGG
jgi:hypothetical protein